MNSLEMKLAAAWPPERWRDVTVLVAVSGGADSVALARAMAQVRGGGEGRLVLAHFNHRLRGEESDADQAFVESLAMQLGVETVTGAAPDLPALALSRSPPLSSESTLRDLRYTFLTETASQTGARYVVTAHTADDQVETILHHILRGTGLAGLAGIPRARQLTPAATLVRPLLDVTRTEVINYLRSLAQAFRDDATNRLEDYTRNRIRLQLLPLLERDFNPHVRTALARLAQIAGQADDFLDQEAQRLLTTAVQSIPGGIALQAAPLAAAHPVLARQVLLVAWRQQGWPLQDMTFEKWEQLRQLAVSGATKDLPALKKVFPGDIHSENASGELRIIRRKSSG
jgi:tRNA(Ile)-lysidine synthase